MRVFGDRLQGKGSHMDIERFGSCKGGGSKYSVKNRKEKKKAKRSK